MYATAVFDLLHTNTRQAQEPVLSPHASPALAPKVKAAKDNDEKVFGAASPVKAEPWTPKVLKFTGRSLVFISKLLMYVYFFLNK